MYNISLPFKLLSPPGVLITINLKQNNNFDVSVLLRRENYEFELSTSTRGRVPKQELHSTS